MKMTKTILFKELLIQIWEARQTLLIQIGILILLYYTNPKYDYHKLEIKNHYVKKYNVSEELIKYHIADEKWREIIDGIAGEVVNVGLWLKKLSVEDYYFFSVGYIDNETVSIGIIGIVFVTGSLDQTTK